MGLDPKAIIPYGHYMAKVPLEAIRSEGLRGKLILVTGMTPTPGGEGKTTVSVGLTQGLAKLGHRPVVTLRQPSLGPVFGIKGGGTGGGLATVVPEEEINIHFTGDMHAVASAHNLLAALVDNAVYRGSIPEFEASGVEWRRTTDASDRALRQVVMGMGGSANSPLRESGLRHRGGFPDYGHFGPGFRPGGSAPPCRTHGGRDDQPGPARYGGRPQGYGSPPGPAETRHKA